MRDLFVVAAGPKGVEVPFARGGAPLEPNCLGYAPPYVGTDGVSVSAVSAGACMVSPSGCTMNFVFTDGTSNYIGTAGHCAGNGKTVIAQVATRVDPTNTIVTLAAIGTVVSSWDQGIGKDFALFRIDPAFKVVPGVAGALGPTGASRSATSHTESVWRACRCRDSASAPTCRGSSI